METLEQAGIPLENTESELHLLLARDHAWDWRRWRVAATGSAIFHFSVMVFLLVYKAGPYVPLPPQRILSQHVTRLYSPPRELTQKAPNKAPVAKELTLESIAPR